LLLLYCCFTAALLLLYCCFTTALLLLYYCFTLVTYAGLVEVVDHVNFEPADFEEHLVEAVALLFALIQQSEQVQVVQQ
jgi:hypothetical protein